MKIKDIITEVPITDYERLGDFKKPGSFNDPRDKKLIQNPKHEQKLIKFFQNTHEDFRIFPVNLPGLRRYSQTGMVTPAFIQQAFGKHPDIANKILSGYENADISDYDLQNYTAYIENTMEYAFNDVLNEVTGKIFVM